MESLSTEHLRKLNLKRMYQGSFHYYHNGTNYCEENFEVLKSKEQSSIQFNCEMISRTKKGELFQANVNYIVNQNFIPTIVQIEKHLGKENCKEIYRLNENTSTIEYKFMNRGVVERREIKVTSKYHIAAPTTAQSMLFLLTKNFDISNKQNFKLIKNDNKWVFKHLPYDANMIAEKASASLRNLNIKGHKLKANIYYLFDEKPGYLNTLHSSRPEEHIVAYVSKFHAIPYLIEDKLNGHRIEINQLKNLVADEA